jgi:hypothetical protein
VGSAAGLNSVDSRLHGIVTLLAGLLLNMQSVFRKMQVLTETSVAASHVLTVFMKVSTLPFQHSYHFAKLGTEHAYFESES